MEKKTLPDLEQDTTTRTPVKENKTQSFLVFLVTVLAAYILLTCVLTFHIIPSSSMEPTIREGSFAVCWRLPFVTGDPSPHYGDIISFKQNTGRILIKRVIGLPGDEISFADGCVYRNGEKLDEPYLREQGKTEAVKQTSYTVPDGYVFMLGDNREHSLDSRYMNDPYISLHELYAKMLFSIALPRIG